MGRIRLGQGIHRGLELGFFLVAAPRRHVMMLPDLGRDLEALVVVRPLLVQHEVARRVAELLLRDLLKHRLEVAGMGGFRDAEIARLKLEFEQPNFLGRASLRERSSIGRR